MSGETTVILTEEPKHEQVLTYHESSEYPTPPDVALGQLSIQSEVELIEINEIAPEGWATNKGLARELGFERKPIRSIADSMKEEHPEWFHTYKDAIGHPREHYHPELVNLLKSEMLGRAEAPEDWSTVTELAKQLGVSQGTVKGLCEEIRQEHPDWAMDFKTKRGNVYNHYSPEMVKVLRGRFPSREQQPEGWMTTGGMREALNITHSVIKKTANKYRQEHPEWFSKFKQTSGRVFEHYHPDLVLLIEDELVGRSVQPEEGWLTNKGLSEELQISERAAGRIADQYREQHPEWFRRFSPRKGLSYEHYSPELAAIVGQEISSRENSPTGWLTCGGLAKELEAAPHTVKRIADQYREEHPEWFSSYKDATHKVSEHMHPEVVKLIKQGYLNCLEAPEGWRTNRRLAEELQIHGGTINRIVDEYRELHPEWFSVYKNAARRPSEHYHPDLFVELKERLSGSIELRNENIRSKQEQDQLKDDIKSFVIDVSNGESLPAQELRGLITLFGSERVIDILYQYHPEYKKVPVPYVKSIIADYLGDFLTTPGGLDLDNLEAGVEFLFDSNLKDSLTEVVKQDCLRFYNQQRKDGLTTDDLDAILEHIGDLRGQTAHFSTEELGEVFEEVESYYRSLFEDIHKPECLVDELNRGRLFPDLNQRINIHEMATKHKMLIADEMGVGKSASAILTKEYLGVGLALIVAPSNVVDTWQNYLSDKVVDSEQVGYFKPGQAPRVLIVESLESLEGINPAEFDYIVISQERLNDRYVEALQEVNYGMLVVDEVHKMKNLISGKRAENLIKLAEGIEDTDGAKYLALLSGTPIPNKVGDISMVLKLLYPEKFEGISNKELTNQILYGDALDLRSLLVPRMQMKSLAESIKMPNLEERIHPVELTAEEREMYEVLLEEDEITASQKLQILRKFSISPSLLEATPDISGSKIQEVGSTLRETFANKDKVVMFVNGYIEGVIRGDNTIVEALGLPEDVEVFAIEGEVEKNRRVAIQQQLQSSGRKMLVLVSGQTADVGVDFSGAEEVYFYNEPWTVYDKKQQLGRVYRPGLSEDLISRTFITRGTIEEGIHSYIGSKYKAIEKLLRGIPISDLEREMLKKSEDQSDPNLEVNPELAEYYFSSWDRMMKIYGYVKELGEDDFVKFLGKYGREYADCYVDVGGRSYQANASRLSGTLIDRFVRERRKSPQAVRVLDIASGPEMLKRHISDDLSDRVVSLDINQHHFAEDGQNRTVGSFLSLPIADNSVDYANLSLALHYTNFVPTKGQYERIEVLQEINRVLSVGGRAVINLMHTLDLKDEPAFREAVTKLGFRVVERYTGKTEDGAHFRTRLFTLEKTHESPRDIKETVNLLGSSLMKGFKFTKSKAKLRDSRKIATSFSIEGQQGVKTKFNETDSITLEEERITQTQMTKLQRKYGSVKAIPRDEVLAGGFSRIFNGKSHVLFRRLVAGSGSVVLR